LKAVNPNKAKIPMLVNGKMTHQLRLGTDIKLPRLEFIMLIGFVLWPFNWSFLCIA
jgi:hypothetical protein